MPTFDLGLVKGPKGDPGDRGPQGIQGTEGPQGPKGDPASVNGISPDDSGNITLTAGNVGAYSKSESDTLLQKKADKNAPDSYFLTTENGFSSGNSSYSKNQFNQVVVNIQTTADAGILQGYYSWVKIGTLPVGFRPSRVLYFPAALDKTSVGQSLQGYVLIDKDGSVSIRAEKSDSQTVSILSCAVFYAAS